MRAVETRGKAAFWGLTTLAAAVSVIPSAYLIDALRRYQEFVDGVSPVPLRPAHPKGVAHQGGAKAEPAGRLEFVEFRLRAPKAKSVTLVGDFNGWRDGTLPLQRQNDGSWELLLPLPNGRFRYAFVVDGQRRLDPAAKTSEEVDGQPASVRTIP